MQQEIRTKSLDAINVLRITLDSQIEDLEQHFETAHLNYLQNTDTRTTDFKNLTSKDQELSKEIEIKVSVSSGGTTSSRVVAVPQVAVVLVLWQPMPLHPACLSLSVWLMTPCASTLTSHHVCVPG